MGGLLIAGTSSDAGKSLLTAGLCRALARRGVDVVPYKAQNMSNNSMVIEGGEIGRAQWLQARAARVEPSVAMNPVLLKPSTDRRSHVVLLGQPHGVLEAGEYAHGRTALVRAAWESYEKLAADHELVVCEGAGSPAEINLRRGDYVNMGLARRFGLPVALVGDIDRGGMLASVYGTWGLLDHGDRAQLAGYLVNKFRGDRAVLEPGLETLTSRTGLDCLGVVPWLEGVWLDSEDTLVVSPTDTRRPDPRTALSVAVVKFPRISNANDIDAIAVEPGVDLVVTGRPDICAVADLLILPGSRSTLGDLAWLRFSGLADVIEERARSGAPVLGICGGYQMLGRIVSDPHGVEADPGTESLGLGVLPVETAFRTEKTLALPHGRWEGHEVDGYEIHHGVAELEEGATPFLDGARRGWVFGTMWHGTMENDDFRRAFLSLVADQSGSGWQPEAKAPGFAARREAMIGSLSDAIENYAPDLLRLALKQVSRG